MVPSTGLNCSSRGRDIPCSYKGLEAAITEPKVLSMGRAEEVETWPRSTRPWEKGTTSTELR